MNDNEIPLRLVEELYDFSNDSEDMTDGEKYILRNYMDQGWIANIEETVLQEFEREYMNTEMLELSVSFLTICNCPLLKTFVNETLRSYHSFTS